MTALDQLNDYLRRIHARLKWQAILRGGAIAAGTALLTTIFLTLVGDHYRFDERVIPTLRFALLAAVFLALFFGLLRPVIRLTQKRTVRAIETAAPEFQQRLLTFTESKQSSGPFSELLAEDALAIGRQYDEEHFAAKAWLLSFAGVAVVSLAILVWLIASGSGLLGYGSALLWTGGAPAGSKPLYAIAVTPGNKTLRRGSDQLIAAHLQGFSTGNVVLRAKYGSASKWESVPMQAQGSSGYEFLFAGVSDNLQYFVQAGDLRSREFTLRVKDLPRVTRVRVALHYPSGVGLRDVVEDPGGDVRAVEGTQATIAVQTDRQLDHGFLVLDDNSKIALTPATSGWSEAHITVSKDGAYHIAAQDEELVRISDDYYIESKKDEAPTVRIARPGRDPHVTPIEEVPISVEASDDFGLHSLQLHYSVNGGPDRSLNFGANGKSATAKTTLAFEDFNLRPGDLVSMYATASDGSKTTRSDIVFAQADAFDYKFKQSQQMAGGGGGGSQSDDEISSRQKEIIAATWNELKGGPKEIAQISGHAKFLSDLQNKLSEQAQTMADRMGKRELASANEQFKQFADLMQEASSEMATAAEQLRPAKWKDSLEPEQKALQSVLHAETIFREIQVAFGQRGGGNGGGGSADRDLARMFDLELDMSKNQYETGQSADPMQGDQQKKLDDALQKLKELARRQQEMAQQSPSQQAFQQRWEQEQLRREAEQLRQQMQDATNKGSSSSASSSSSSSSANASASQAARNAMRSLQQAEQEMSKSVSQADANARKRAQQALSEAQQQLERAMQSQAGNSLSQLAERSHELAAKQMQLGENVKRQYGADGINMARNEPGSGLQMPEMNGPGYSSWFRRRLDAEMPRTATPAEKELANQGERLARQTSELQRQMQEQVQQLATTDPEAARKLRQALSDAEQHELALRMQKSSEWLRSGHGAETWPQQDSITEGMRQLSNQLQEAQQALGKGSGSTQQAGSPVRALDEIQRLEQQLAAGGAPSIGDTQQAIDDLSRLGRADGRLRQYTADALTSLRHAKGQDGLLDARFGAAALRDLQRLQIELERELGLGAAASAHAGTPEETPEQYKEAVAEYFRRLSK
jgi:hypothetical protein